MTRKEFLDSAEKCICTDREGQYGSPENSFSSIAMLWTEYLGTVVTPRDVGVMMALFKISRIKTGRFKDDSYIDAIGYLACAGEIASTEEK